MNRYTIILMYPEYITDGCISVFADQVTGTDPFKAVKRAQKRASAANDDTVPSEDFTPVLVLVGDCSVVLGVGDFAGGTA